MAMTKSTPVGLATFIPAAHRALDRARVDERAAITDALNDANFVAISGEPEVGKTSVVEHAFRAAGLARVRIDLNAAASPAHVSWLVARGVAKLLVSPTNLSLLSGAPDLAPSGARGDLMMLQRIIGDDMATLALADAPTIDVSVDRAFAAIEVVAAERPVTVWIDHLESPGLTARHPVDAAELLWSLRSLAQRTPFQTVISFQAASSRDIGGRDAAFHQDGRWVRVTRPADSAWRTVCEELGVPVPASVLGELTRLLEGHPSCMLLALGEIASGDLGAPADELVSRLASRDDGHAALTVQHARSLHRLGGEVMTKIAHGHGPYAQPGLSRRNDIQVALGRMHKAGLIFQPRQRDWQITNPLVAIRLRGMLRPIAAPGPEPLD